MAMRQKSDMIGSNQAPDGAVLAKEREQLAWPPLYRVLLHNDDYTTMDFVVLVLEKIFHKDQTEATRIMLEVHQQGRGVAGVYPRDLAETKVALVHEVARRHEYPLKCTFEQDI